MTTHVPSTHDRTPSPDPVPPTAPERRPTDDRAAPRPGRRRSPRPAVVPLVHPPRSTPAVRRVPPRWGDTAPGPVDPTGSALHDEDGSLVTEYGLVAVLGATIVGLAVRWASGGAVTELLSALLARVRELVGA